MKILYIDIDTLRPDHLGCYGYPRTTSPVIDALAEAGIVFTQVYASDTPCLPSRTALTTGQFGLRNGIVNHGGPGAELRREGEARQFVSAAARHSWMRPLRDIGYWTASISTFAERHSAYHFDAGFNECVNLGTRGLETADQVIPVAESWLERNRQRSDWFLHVHLWDPHTPYRTPSDFGNPFADQPHPDWITETVRGDHWGRPGPHSAQEVAGFGPRTVWDAYPRQPLQMTGPADVTAMFDGYDAGVAWADRQVGRLLGRLEQLGLDDVAIVVSSDHGENLGELGIYCDHQTADEPTTHLPAIVVWPGGVLPAGQRLDGLHYQFDLMATVLELAGAEVPETWDGQSFLPTLLDGRGGGRDALVLSHGAWTVQRSLRFDDHLLVRTAHDGYHGFPEIMLFDLVSDPHEQHNLADDRPEMVKAALDRLEAWEHEQLRRTPDGRDPLQTVLQGSGPWHSRTDPGWYFERLRSTGRATWADRFERREAAHER